MAIFTIPRIMVLLVLLDSLTLPMPKGRGSVNGTIISQTKFIAWNTEKLFYLVFSIIFQINSSNSPDFA